MVKKSVVIGLLVGTLTACSVAKNSGSRIKMNSMSQEQALEDLQVLKTSVKTLYGPLQYKEERFKFKFDELVEKARAEIQAGKTDAEYAAAFKKLLASFRDGHVGIEFPGSSAKSQRLSSGVFISPVEDKAVVMAVNDTAKALGVEVGDVVAKIDGRDTFEYLPIINQYEAFGNDLSDRHNIYAALYREFYIKELLPSKPYVRIQLQKLSGELTEIELPWTADGRAIKPASVAASARDYTMSPAGYIKFNDAANGSVLLMGSREPFFAEGLAESANEVEPSKQFLDKYGLTREEVYKDGKYIIYASLYRKDGKTILLVRQPGYSPTISTEKMIAAYQAILDQYDDLADVLVVDQTHNPGGSLDYVQEFSRLFIPRGKSVANLVQKYHADRKWFNDFTDFASLLAETGLGPVYQQRANMVEAALDAGKTMTDAYPLLGTNTLRANERYSWSKPMLVLADELAGSCGDIFPMLIKRNNIAKVFGQRTMGLGGNVEEVLTLPNSQASVRLTRGLYTTFNPTGEYADQDFVENNGILPDYPFSISLEDVRQWGSYKYSSYIAEMSKTALLQIPAAQ